VIKNESAIIPIAVTLICLAPFLNKAFHMDEPLFVWTARQIQTKPADFYGFSVNWYGTTMPMSEVTENPPMAGYYIAALRRVFGESEIALHAGFLIPAVAAAAGTYYLAAQLCQQATLASLASVLTPAFLVSGSSAMCDVMMLAFWVWAAAFWVRGTKTNNNPDLLFAAVLITFCALTKYFGAALIVLLFAYSIFQKRRVGVWVLFLLIPAVFLGGYQWLTHTLYGRGLLSDAASYAIGYRWTEGENLFSKTLIGLAFVGGSITTALFYSPLVWSRRALVYGVIVTILSVFAVSIMQKAGVSPIRYAGSIRWGFVVQLCLMVVGGGSILCLGIMDFHRHRDADSLLLLLWVFGTFVFACFINWAVSVRSVLPIIPAAGILVARRVSRYEKTVTLWPLIPAAIVALAVCWADYTLAGTARTAAEKINRRFEKYPGRVWFQGHWGFQYYMEAKGYQAIDFDRPKPAQGDILIVPSNNSFLRQVPAEYAGMIQSLQLKPCRWLATMTGGDAGFYSDEWGAIPYALGPVRAEKYSVFLVKAQ
jgi:4-amino-4-deoxy-L-arabinose transferase-like glycosyltransferase